MHAGIFFTVLALAVPAFSAAGPDRASCGTDVAPGLGEQGWSMQEWGHD
jgi:hypothetical protein